MGKMYYSEEEAAQKLQSAGKDMQELVSAGELRAYPDGAKSMYKAADIDALAPGAEEIELAPAAEGDAVTLAEADAEAEVTKSDTVITSEGISIFDDEDLEIDTGDPMAKTAIAPSVEDEISLDGIGSGSGLLDLTRESDDTSLGEVLEHIDVEAGIPSGPSAVDDSLPDAEPMTGEMTFEAPTVVEEVDPSAGAFTGLVLAACLVMMLGGMAALAVLMGEVPGYVFSIQDQMPIVLGGAVVLAIVLVVVGLMIGKAAAARASALQRGG